MTDETQLMSDSFALIGENGSCRRCGRGDADVDHRRVTILAEDGTVLGSSWFSIDELILCGFVPAPGFLVLESALAEREERG